MSQHRPASRQGLRRLAGALGSVGLLLAGLCGPPGLGVARCDVIQFEDGTFNDADWDLTVFYQTGAGGTASAIQVPAGGNPGSFREITNIVYDAPPYVTMIAFHRYIPASYNPSVQGAITAIDFYEEAKLLVGVGQGQGSAPAVRQGGLVYLADLYITPELDWTPHALTSMTALSFHLADNPSAHPDFSMGGGPIEFGIVRSNSTFSSGYTIVSGLDNWRMVLRTESPTPVEPGSWGGIKGLFR